jgi:hypothetical protein
MIREELRSRIITKYPSRQDLDIDSTVALSPMSAPEGKVIILNIKIQEGAARFGVLSFLFIYEVVFN